MALRRFAPAGLTGLAGLLALSPITALAHGAIPGATPFYVGLLHPLLAPAHVLALLALGLYLGRVDEPRKALAIWALGLGLVLGGLLTLPLADPDTDRGLLPVALVCAVLVAAGRTGPAGLVATVCGLIGLLVGLGSGDPGFAPWQRFLTIGGSVVGALLITGQLAFWGELLGRQPRLAHGTAIGQRILGGWLVAISLLMLVLGWVGPLTKSAG